MTATIIASAAAIVIMLYHGCAMSHSAAIRLWSSGLLPVIGLTYAFLGACSLLAVLDDLGLRAQPRTDALVRNIEIGLIGYVAIMLYSLVHAARFGSTGAARSITVLLGAPLNRWFWVLVVTIGLLLPAVVLIFGNASWLQRLFVAVALLAGYYTFRVLIFKAGLFDPMQSFVPQFDRLRSRQP